VAGNPQQGACAAIIDAMTAPPTEPEALPRPQPQSLTDLFVSFTLLALQGFGGVLAVVQRELVEKKRWMTREEFVEEWAVAQIMPGPNVVNLSLMIGHRYFGLRGAMAALAGMLTVPLLVVLLLALVYAQFAGHSGVAGALRGMGAVAAGLIAATGLKLMSALKNHPLGLPLCIALALLCFTGIALLRLPLVYVLIGLGVIACGLTYRKLGP
jgi:chromate transporter